jgi:hypothetical protein
MVTMDNKATELLDRLSRLSPFIAEARNETIDYWSPDEPPITVAFAEIGHAIVDKIDELDSDAQQAAFQMIEEGISSDDEQLSTAVATGLIEGIVGHASKLGSFQELLAKLGQNSRSHAIAWHGG